MILCAGVSHPPRAGSRKRRRAEKRDAAAATSYPQREHFERWQRHSRFKPALAVRTCRSLRDLDNDV
jgi:hypothetical protein